MSQPTILLPEIKGFIDSALDDLYNEGLITAASYNKKSAERFILWAINNADRHICLNIALSATISLYVPADLRTIFFERQEEYVSEWLTAHDTIEAADTKQYAQLIDESQRYSVVSVLSETANAYGTLPVGEIGSPASILHHALPHQIGYEKGRKYIGTTGQVYTEQPNRQYFYVEPNSQKMILSKAFSAPRWVTFEAQIAPVNYHITNFADSELDDYEILAPYWCKDWLMHEAIVRTVSPVVANNSGYIQAREQARLMAFQNRPGTGNVIIGGDDLDGNYESSFNF